MHLKYLLTRLQKLQALIENHGLARIVGASLFFVCARDYYEGDYPYVKVAEVYLIDLCHMEIFESSSERDEGILLGLKNV